MGQCKKTRTVPFFKDFLSMRQATFTFTVMGQNLKAALDSPTKRNIG